MHLRAILLWLVIVFFGSTAFCQTVVVASKSLSGSIAATGTFQLIQAQSTNRLGCSIQNNASLSSGDTMWVYFGISPTKASAVQLTPGQSVSCAVEAAIIVGDPVYIAGTSGDAFYANFQ